MFFSFISFVTNNFFMQTLPKDVLGIVQSYFTMREYNNWRSTCKAAFAGVEQLALDDMHFLEAMHGLNLFIVNKGHSLFHALMEQTYNCKKCGEREHVDMKEEALSHCKTCYETLELHRCYNCNMFDTFFERCAECSGHFCEECAAHCIVATCLCCDDQLCDACV